MRTTAIKFSLKKNPNNRRIQNVNYTHTDTYYLRFLNKGGLLFLKRFREGIRAQILFAPTSWVQFSIGPDQNNSDSITLNRARFL